MEAEIANHVWSCRGNFQPIAMGDQHEKGFDCPDDHFVGSVGFWRTSPCGSTRPERCLSPASAESQPASLGRPPLTMNVRSWESNMPWFFKTRPTHGPRS